MRTLDRKELGVSEGVDIGPYHRLKISKTFFTKNA